ncbi:MAG TPA: hypothetical protein EYH12_05420, partial [Psychromonas hadalis]|nr:hypothetical protein [Psychromonas hadalis]
LMKLRDGDDVSAAYLTTSPDGNTLRSSTTIIRNPKKEAIGLLCINSNIDAPFQSVIRSLIPKRLPESDSPETFSRNNDDVMETVIRDAQETVAGDKSISVSKKNRETVYRLYALGVFDLKDSIPTVATQLAISIHSIYRYLRDIKVA